MAALDKYTSNAVIYAMRHNTRENPRPPKNTDIDSSKSQYNYSLIPENRGSTARENKDYYNERILLLIPVSSIRSLIVASGLFFRYLSTKSFCLLFPLGLPSGFLKAFPLSFISLLSPLIISRCLFCDLPFRLFFLSPHLSNNLSL